MASSGRQFWDNQTRRYFTYDQQTNEVIYSDGTRVRYASQPAVNVPRTVAGAAQQLPANNFSTQPYNQQYTSSPPAGAGQGIQNLSRQLQNLSIATPSASTAPTLTRAAGRAIDGAEVVRNPQIRGAPPRRVSFSPAIQRGLLDPGSLLSVVGVKLSADGSRVQGAGPTGELFRSRQGMVSHIASLPIA